MGIEATRAPANVSTSRERPSRASRGPVGRLLTREGRHWVAAPAVDAHVRAQVDVITAVIAALYVLSPSEGSAQRRPDN